jgi:general secretion pathway protein C
LFDTIINKGAEPVRWLIIAGIAYTLATGIWSFFETPVSSLAQPAERSAAQPSSRPPANVNWILTKHLFGEAGAAPQQVVDNNEPAVQTRLPLELQSVFVADEIEASAAIVAQRGKPGKLYRVGENLPGNAELVEVMTDRIILRRAGVRETLLFPKSKTSFSADPTVAEDDDELADSGFQEAATDIEAGGLDNDTDDATNAEVSPEELLETYRQKLVEDAQGTLNDLGIETVDEGDGGYRIGDVAQSPYLRQTGLQAGDVILSVNGRPVGDIQQDQLELENIMAQGSARIEVQRGSRRFFITASLK